MSRLVEDGVEFAFVYSVVAADAHVGPVGVIGRRRGRVQSLEDIIELSPQNLLQTNECCCIIESVKS